MENRRRKKKKKKRPTWKIEEEKRKRKKRCSACFCVYLNVKAFRSVLPFVILTTQFNDAPQTMHLYI